MKKTKAWLLCLVAYLAFGASSVWAQADVATFAHIEGMVENILGVALRLLGLAVGVMIIVGGFQLLTSGGSQEGAQKARGTFTMAIFGLVLAILAWFILVFIKNFTGVEVTEFAIPQ
ncbi:MAG: hypothetical protein ABIB61_04490 [Candidatus Shapirobacteria bacterium]